MPLGAEQITQSQPLIIDRHVLTESEVVPSLAAQPQHEPQQRDSASAGQSSGLWTSRHQRSLKSSIVYKFRVYCAQHYFGDGCMNFCRPRNDQFGHYNCSASGQKLCHEGWTGLDCDRAKCRAGCSAAHGFCERPDTCQCRPGWNGPRCDECLTYPGCQNGFCLSAWQCNCHANWGGVLCDQDLNYCATHQPCNNNATCQNVAPNRYKCLCADGYAGPNCDLELAGNNIGATSSNASLLAHPAASSIEHQVSAGCALNPCLNGGTCLMFNYNQQQINATNNQPANTLDADKQHLLQFLLGSEDATSEPSNQMYRCQCLAGWTGDYCQWAESLSVPSADVILDALANVTDSPSVTAAFSSSPADPQQQLNDDYANKRNLTSEPNSSLPDVSGQLHPLDAEVLIVANSAPNQAQQQHVQLEMKHLLSGVVLASAMGVFAAALLLAWCFLAALERNRFSLVQLNLVSRQNNSDSSSDNSSSSQRVGFSTLRRVQEKIRDSLRCRSNSASRQIKPQTKLSLDNVLRPPPSYEESSNYASKLDIIAKMQRENYNANSAYDDGKSLKSHHEPPSAAIDKQNDLEAISSQISIEVLDQFDPNLVINDNEIVVPIEAIASCPPQSSNHSMSSHLNCPRHGHLYRKQKLYSIAEREDLATRVEIEYKPNRSLISRSNHYHTPHEPRDLG